ncbi:MAG: hypothetical protein HOE90_14925 [Bacteriovoracaceae bacterium]|jgi:D-3-phosphoglycerate dehydrogenase / 2-oxoglutarate reductase|nr:hypothetical protein [Bacteriovoracaceae bacterium]
MKKHSSYGILRLNLSRYFTKNFSSREKDCINEIEGLHFIEKEQSCDFEKLILISTTQVDFNKLDTALLDKTSLIIHSNSGHDNFSLDFTSSVDFPIVLGNKLRARAVSEYIIKCFFHSIEKIPFCNEWDAFRSFERTLIEKRKVLIIGNGQIGTIVHKQLDSAGVNCTTFDPFKEQKSSYDSPAMIKTSVLETLEHTRFDHVILACGLNPSSRHLLDKSFFEGLSDNCVIINAARGALIDQLALREFLTGNPKAFVYLDVFENEPDDLSAFDQVKNALTSSHIAGVHGDLEDDLIDFEVKTLKDYLSLGRSEFYDRYENSILSNRIKSDCSGNTYLI